MKPKPFKPEIYSNDELYVRDVTTGLVWHRSIYRTLRIAHKWFIIPITCVILNSAGLH